MTRDLVHGKPEVDLTEVFVRDLLKEITSRCTTIKYKYNMAHNALYIVRDIGTISKPELNVYNYSAGGFFTTGKCQNLEFAQTLKDAQYNDKPVIGLTTALTCTLQKALDALVALP